ncbi:FxsA family protein [Rhizobium helianthi]|uniref:FxsA family protein n=1 Tax=Rhizobium helianthi TaxID=1132695 RepID=A0ABW4M7U8_9HYPH
MRTSLLPLMLLGLPLAEIAGFVIVGKWLGVFGTLGLIVLSSLVGIFLLRQQGLAVLRQVNEEGRNGRVPSEAIGNGAMIVFAAILLIIPGFLTDIVGILLFIPAIRSFLWRRLGQRVVVRTTYSRTEQSRDSSYSQSQPDKYIDLDSDEFERRPNPSSPWSSGPKKED